MVMDDFLEDTNFTEFEYKDYDTIKTLKDENWTGLSENEVFDLVLFAFILDDSIKVVKTKI